MRAYSLKMQMEDNIIEAIDQCVARCAWQIDTYTLVERKPCVAMQC